MNTWTEFEERLATTLRNLEGREYLIISADNGTPGYVQFFRDVNPLIAEAAASVFVPTMDTGPLILDDWEQPVEEMANWQFAIIFPDAQSSEDFEDLAQRSSRALQNAYGITSPGILVHTAWRDPGNHPLDLPELVLRRETSA